MSSQPEQEPPCSLPLEKQESRARLWIEVGVVLALAVLPNLFHAISSFWIPKGAAAPFVITTLSYFFPAVQESLPVLYIMYLSGKPWCFFGLHCPRFFWDPIWGALIFVAVFLVMAGLAWVLPREDPTRPRILELPLL